MCQLWEQAAQRTAYWLHHVSGDSAPNIHPCIKRATGTTLLNFGISATGVEAANWLLNAGKWSWQKGLNTLQLLRNPPFFPYAAAGPLPFIAASITPIFWWSLLTACKGRTIPLE
jgi:hypothetical protein